MGFQAPSLCCGLLFLISGGLISSVLSSSLTYREFSQQQVNVVPDMSVNVHWMAPFLSGGGYCSEAISYVLALSDFFTVTIEQVNI